MGKKAKKRLFTVELNFKGHDHYNRSYVTGRAVQMAKCICSDDGIGKNFRIQITDWQMKRGIIMKKRIRFETTDEKFMKFLDAVNECYPNFATHYLVKK